MQVKLTPRLKRITEMVPKDSIVADIGTDHGYISIFLLQNNISKRVIASDVNAKPLQSAEENIKACGLGNKINTRLGSGLEVLSPGEVDTVIIAGMGGLLIAELLEKVPKVVEGVSTFILQPMQAQEQLRRYLVEGGYRIIEDVLVKEDHKIYEIIKAVRGKQMVDNEILFEIGFHLEKNPLPLVEEFLLARIKILEDIIAQVENKASKEAVIKHQASIVRLRKIQEVLECLQRSKR